MFIFLQAQFMTRAIDENFEPLAAAKTCISSPLLS